MKLVSISGLVFYVKDLDATKEFYEKLGFRFSTKEPERRLAYLNWFWIEFRPQDKGHDDKPGGQYVHIKVDNTEEFHKGLVEQGFKPETEAKDLSYGRKGFRLTDPDGYQLVFFE